MENILSYTYIVLRYASSFSSSSLFLLYAIPKGFHKRKVSSVVERREKKNNEEANIISSSSYREPYMFLHLHLLAAFSHLLSEPLLESPNHLITIFSRPPFLSRTSHLHFTTPLNLPIPSLIEYEMDKVFSLRNIV